MIELAGAIVVAAAAFTLGRVSVRSVGTPLTISQQQQARAANDARLCVWDASTVKAQNP